MTARFRSLPLMMVVAVATLAAPAATGQAERGTVITGGQFSHVVTTGESLWSVGARFGAEPRVLARLNGLRPDARLWPGQSLRVDNRHLVPDHPGSIAINIPQRLLFLTDSDGATEAFPVGLGKPDWPTFTGPFRIVALERNPVWDVPPSIQEEMRAAGKPVVTTVQPGPENPLGTHWIALDRPGFGIHGTNAPASVHHFVTHGCIRAHPDDIATLFSRVAVGMTGEVRYVPVLLAWTDERTVLLEAHPDVYRRAPSPMMFLRRNAREEGFEDAIDWSVASEVLRAADGVPVDVSRRRDE